jgi:hypothetical protein
MEGNELLYKFLHQPPGAAYWKDLTAWQSKNWTAWTPRLADLGTNSLKPIEYRADWPHMGHQRLFFRCYGGQGIDERVTIKVTGSNPDMPVFCG